MFSGGLSPCQAFLPLWDGTLAHMAEMQTLEWRSRAIYSEPAESKS